jgi:hypothetical protein
VEGLNVSSNYREAIKFTCSHGGSAVWDGSICLIGPLNFLRMINSRGEVTPGAGSGGGGPWTQLVLLDVHVTPTGSGTREGTCVAIP